MLEALRLHVATLGKRAHAYRMTYGNPNHPRALEADAQAETTLRLIGELS